MTYPAISARRMPYDIDGCEIGYRYESQVFLETLFSHGISSWLNSASKGNLNNVDRSQYWGDIDNYPGFGFWFFFPEKREISHLGFLWAGTQCNNTLFQGSNDTTNGMDGTWETGIYSFPTPTTAYDFWRSNIMPISFSEPKKVIRLGFRYTGPNAGLSIYALHVYGQKTAGQTPDDILFVDASTGAEFTSLKDWGDRPEGTTVIWSFKVKNASTSKIANNVNVQLNHADFTIAWAPDGPWQSVLDIASIGIGALSNTIYIRNQLAPPLLALGPKQARVIATVGSWT